MTWEDLQSAAGQLAALVAVTGLTYRLMRMWWPDVPEAIVQVVAAIYSTVTVLTVTYAPELPRHRWLIVGVFSGVLLSAQVIKLLDWSASAMTKTGAPEAGLAEKPPAWFVAELARGTTLTSTVPPKPIAEENLTAQMKVNDAAVAKATKETEP